MQKKLQSPHEPWPSYVIFPSDAEYCGGYRIRSDQTGMLQSSTPSANYRPYMMCGWTIQGRASEVTYLYHETIFKS